MGGVGEERHISIQSGNCVADALEEAGLNVAAADITPDNLDVLADDSIDVFFPALHGRFASSSRYSKTGPSPTPAAALKQADWRSTN